MQHMYTINKIYQGDCVFDSWYVAVCHNKKANLLWEEGEGSKTTDCKQENVGTLFQASNDKTSAQKRSKR